MRFRNHCVMLLGWGLMAGFVSAGELPSSFTLGKYVPGDSWLYIHSVDNPDRAWVKKQWGEFFTALQQSGIDSDITSLIFSAIESDQREELETVVQQAVKLLGSVKWNDLISKEVVMLERFKPGQIGPEYAFMARGKLSSADGNIAALVAILKEVASRSEKISIVHTRQDGVELWQLKLGNNFDDKMMVMMFRYADVIGVSFGEKMIHDIVGQMSGKIKKHSILVSPRFKQALKQIKSPSDSMTFIDMKRVLGGVNDILHKVTKDNANDDEESKQAVEIGKKILVMADVVDYIMTTTQTKDRREVTKSLYRFQDGKQNSSLAEIILDRKPFKKFDQYIPADATGFMVNGVINFEKFYDQVLDFVTNQIPDGQNHILKYNTMLTTINFDPKRDIFSWLSGEMVNISIQPAIPNPMTGGDSVTLIRVKDAELATNKINTLVNFVTGMLQSQGQSLMISPAQVNAEGFRTITHPMLAMFMQPVVGVHGEWLIVGTSGSAVNKCLDVAMGKSPSILKNARFKKEGIIPKGPVMAISFKDTSKFGDEIAQVIGMVGIFGGLAMGNIPDDESGDKKKVIQKLMGSLMKLGPVFQKLDFFSSESSVMTYDGKLDLRTTKVVMYKSETSDSQKTAAINN